MSTLPTCSCCGEPLADLPIDVSTEYPDSILDLFDEDKAQYMNQPLCIAPSFGADEPIHLFSKERIRTNNRLEY